MKSLDKILEDREIAEQAGFAKPKRKKQSAAKLGAKHAARVTINRTVKDTVGNGLIGGIIALIAKAVFKSATK